MYQSGYPDKKNVKADKISKAIDCDDWQIDNETYTRLDDTWGPHTVDRFATDYNTKCSVFNSKHWCPRTLGIDAFNRHWGKEINWIVPPPSEISRCVHKIKQDKADSTLIVPLWHSAPYWPLLHTVRNKSVQFEFFIKESIILPSTVVKKGRGRNGMFGKSIDFSMLAMKIRF